MRKVEHVNATTECTGISKRPGLKEDVYQISLHDRVAKIHSAACLWTEYKKRVATRILEKNHHDGERNRLHISNDKDRDSMSTCVLLTLTTRIRKKTIAYTDRHVELSQGTVYACKSCTALLQSEDTPRESQKNTQLFVKMAFKLHF